MSSKIIAIANQKGGVGKTTSAVNLAAGLAAAEKRTLLLDCDPQGNATSGVGIAQETSLANNLYRVLAGELSPNSAILSTDLPYLQVIPGHVDLVGMEVELKKQEGDFFHFKKLLTPLRSAYDYIIIDCPPSLGVLTLNALTAADAVLIPMQSEYYAMEGLSHLMRTVELVRSHYNPQLQIAGILLTMHDQRSRLAREVEREVRTHFGEQVFKTIIPRNVRLSEAPSFGKPVLLYDIACKGAGAYLELTQELIEQQQVSKPHHVQGSRV